MSSGGGRAGGAVEQVWARGREIYRRAKGREREEKVRPGGEREERGCKRANGNEGSAQ